MYSVDIIIENKNLKEKHDQQYESWVNLASDYIFHLERTGQILKTHGHISINGKTLKVSVFCPEKDAFSLKNCNPYNIKTIHKLEQHTGSKIKHIITGREAEYADYVVPKNSSFYILRNGWDSPLICGDTHNAIPLYKFPRTDLQGDGYDNIYFWNQNYERLYGLWLSSGAYEGFAEQQLHDPWSDINKTGRELCRLVEDLTGVPTYYFMFNYRGWSEEDDRKRKCPVTGSDWLIEGKSSSDFIAFKCDESRLVSELSTNTDCENDTPKNSYFELTYKSLGFTIEALDFRIKTYQKEMADVAISDNDYSDLANDVALLKSIKKYLQGGE